MACIDYKEPFAKRYSSQYPEDGINGGASYIPIRASDNLLEPLASNLHKLVPIVDDDGWYIKHQQEIYGKALLIQQLERELIHDVTTLWSMSENALLQLSERIEKLRRRIFNIENPKSCLERTLSFFGCKRSLPKEGSLYELQAEVSKVARWMRYFKNTQFHQDQIFRDEELPRPVHIVVTEESSEAFLLFTKKRLGDLQIGKGSHKIVKVALKIGTPYKFATASVRDSINEARDEAAIWSKLSHLSCVVREISFVTYPSKKKALDGPSTLKGRFLTEYCSEGPLYNYIYSQCFKKEERASLFCQLIRAVAQIHKMGLMHRDISSFNLLLQRKESSLKLKIADFGSACTMLDKNQRVKYRTHLWYISPELAEALLNNNPSEILKATTFALDSWSVACCLYELWFGSLPPWTKAYYYPDNYRDLDSFCFDATMDNYYFPYPGPNDTEAAQRWKSEMAFLHYLLLYNNSFSNTPIFVEPKKINSPEHLVWEMFCQRISVTQAYQRLKEIEFTNPEQ